MVKKIATAFLVLLLAQVGSWFYFNGEIATQSAKLDKKSERLSKLKSLEEKWSQKSQAEELKRVYEFLAAFDVKYSKKEHKKRKTLTMQLPTQNVDKVVSFILNRKIVFKEFSLKKIDNYTLEFSVVL